MARNRGIPLARGRRSDRITTWIRFNVELATLTGNAATLLAVLNAGALALRPFTIVRTRGFFHITSDQAAASETLEGAWGSIVVQEEAADAGIASVPSPLAEPDAAYIVYEPFVNEFLFGDGTGFTEPGGINLTFDSKAMRKVGLSEDMVIVAELASAPGASISIQGRMLLKLH